MANKKIRTVLFRRKREKRTNYKKRLNYVISGIPRAVIRKTSNSVIVQIVDYAPDGDITRVLVNSGVLPKYGWKYSCSNMPAAYLAGFLAGKRAKENNISRVVVDLGLQSPILKSKLFSAVKGLTDAGVDCSADEKSFPDEKRLSGSHIAGYASALKTGSEKYDRQFSGYKKTGAEPEKIADAFMKVKAGIEGGAKTGNTAKKEKTGEGTPNKQNKNTHDVPETAGEARL